MPPTRVTLSELRDLDRSALALDRRPGGALAALFPGPMPGRRPGPGLDFEGVRPYQWGDDPGAIDWRVTARTGKLHTKVFREGREGTLWLVLDAGPAMHFATRGAFKWVRAAQLAALAAWLAWEEEARLGLVLHGGGERPQLLPAARGEGALMRLFGRLAEVAPPDTHNPAGLEDAARVLTGRLTPGARVLCIGACDDFHPTALAPLAARARLTVVWLHDPLERHPPPPGDYPLTDGRRCRGWLTIGGARQAHRWRRAFESRRRTLARGVTRLGGHFLDLGVERPPTELLEREPP